MQVGVVKQVLTPTVLLCILFFARRDDFLSGRLIEERDTGAVHREDSGDR